MIESAEAHSVPAADGTPILWRRFGSGTPVILLHGGHGDWMHWFRNVAALSAYHEVWIPDMPNFGDSGDLPVSSFAHLCDATLSSLDTLLGAGTAIDLVGFSFGGMVAAAIATKRPVTRLILVGSGGHRSVGRDHPALLNWHKTDDAEARITMLNANVRTFMFHDAAAVSPLIESIYARQCLRTRFRSRGSWGGATLQGFLQTANVKTLLLWGDQDVTLASPTDYSAQLREANIRHELVLIPGAGHWLQCEAAEVANAAFIAFLQNAKD